MNYKLLGILCLVVIVLNGCSQISTFTFDQDRTGPEEKNHGPGLEVTFTIDEEFLPRLRYQLNLKNNGEKRIVIDEQDFALTSKDRTLNGEVPLVREDIENLKSKLFENGDLVLGPHQEQKYTGIIAIGTEYYQDLSNEDVSMILKLNYPYSTEFSTNVELNPETFEFGAQRFDMSGPIIIDNIEGKFSSQEEIDIIYTLKNRGDTSSSIGIENARFELGTQSLSCIAYEEKEGNKLKLNQPRIPKNTQNLFYVCPVDISEYDSSATTITTGEYSYNYNIEKEEKISFPQTRNKGGFN